MKTMDLGTVLLGKYSPAFRMVTADQSVVLNKVYDMVRMDLKINNVMS